MSIQISMEELKAINDKITVYRNDLAKATDELEAQRKRFEEEKEGLLERNQRLQTLYDNLDKKFEKANRSSTNHKFKERELEAELKKLEEQLEFYSCEAKKTFSLTAQIDEMKVQLVELSNFKAETLKSNTTVVLKETEAQNNQLKKQVKILEDSVKKLEASNQKLLKLAEDRDKKAASAVSKTESLETQLKTVTGLREEAEKEIESLQLSLKQKDSELETVKRLRSRDIVTWKQEIKLFSAQKDTAMKEAQSLREELARVIEGVRKAPVSGSEGIVRPSRDDKMILESVVAKNKEIDNTIRTLEKENRRLKLHSEVLEEKVEQKESSLLQLSAYLYSDPIVKAKEGVLNMTEADSRRIQNAKFNKSADEMRELIERVVLENIKLKKEKENGSQKQIKSEGTDNQNENSAASVHTNGN
mgnify:CR=1 FL=1